VVLQDDIRMLPEGGSAEPGSGRGPRAGRGRRQSLPAFPSVNLRVLRVSVV